MKKILFIFNHALLEIQKSILRELFLETHSRGYCNSLVLFDTIFHSQKKISEENRRHMGIDEYVLYKDHISEALIDETSISKIKEKTEPCGRMNPENRLSYLDVGYSGLSIRGLVDIKNSVYEISSVRQFIDAVSPDIVISGVMINSFMKCLSIVANEKGIPHIGMHLGRLCFDSKNIDDIDISRQYFYNVDYMCIWGQRVEDAVHKKGYHKKNLIKTGPLFKDYLSSVGLTKRDEILEKYEIKNKITIVYPFLSFISFMHDERLMQRVVELFDKLERNLPPEYCLIIKTHPLDHSFKLEKGIRFFDRYRKNNIKVISDESIYSILSCADMFLVSGSTADLEAMTLDKPMLYFGVIEKDEPYIDECCLICESPEDVIANIEKSSREDLKRHGRNKYVEYEYYSLDGNCRKRIADLIEEH